MKEQNREIDFGIIENAELSELETLSERVAPAGNDTKKRIQEMSMRKYEIRMSAKEAHEETVSGSEPYRPRTLRKIFAAAAACVALAGAVAGGAVLLNRKGSSPAAVSDSSVTENPPVQQHEVFFRKGSSQDGEVILTGSHITEAKVYCFPKDNNAEEMVYTVNCQLDSEGTQIFARATEELTGPDYIISIWVDGKCEYSPNITSAITDGFLSIQGDFDYESATELAEKLSNANTAYGLTADGIIYGDDHAELVTDCLNSFIQTADDSVTSAEYCEYDVNGDNIPELFIKYFGDDRDLPMGVCELYALKDGKYEPITTKTENIWVHTGMKDGVIVSKENSDPLIYIAFRLNENNELELVTQLQSSEENGETVYTIRYESCSEEEWNQELDTVLPQDALKLGDLTTTFFARTEST